MGRKFKLDSEAERRLSDVICKHEPVKRQEYYAELEEHLTYSHNPSAFIMKALPKLGRGESLGPVEESEKNKKPKGKGKGESERGDKGKKDDDRRGSKRD